MHTIQTNMPYPPQDNPYNKQQDIMMLIKRITNAEDCVTRQSHISTEGLHIKLKDKLKKSFFYSAFLKKEKKEALGTRWFVFS